MNISSISSFVTDTWKQLKNVGDSDVKKKTQIIKISLVEGLGKYYQNEFPRKNFKNIFNYFG